MSLSKYIQGGFLYFIMAGISFSAFSDNITINIAVPEDFAPFYFKNSKGEFEGASIEVAHHVFNKLGYKTQITQFSSMKFMLRELETGRQSVSINLTATEERQRVAKFTSEPHIYEYQNFIVRTDSPFTYNGQLDHISQFRFGPIFGWTYGPKFDDSQKLNKIYVNNSPEQLRKLLSGRFDVAINNPQFFLNLARTMNVSSAFKVINPSIYVLPVTMAVSHKYPKKEMLVEQINKEVKKLKSTEKYESILKKYGFRSDSIALESKK